MILKWRGVIAKNRALARGLGISGTSGFIVGNELVPGMLDLNGLKELIARAGRGNDGLFEMPALVGK
jgi:protein-disulfide isomerase